MIVVTAPTGDIGRQLVAKLVNAGASVRVIARDPERLPEAILDRVEVIEGSHGDPGVVDEAFQGASALFWLTPPDPKAPSVETAYVDFTRPAAAAVKAHEIPRVVTVSAIGRDSELAGKAGFVTGSLAMDDLIARSGAAFRALTMPSFMDNIIRQAAGIRDKGVFFSPISGDLRLPSVATRDIAAVAARWLLDDHWTGRDDRAVLGPQDISFNDMAAIMSEVLARPVRFQQIGFDAYKAQFLRFGMSEAMAQGMTDMAWAKDHGIDLSVTRNAENTTPTTFRQWCEDTLKPAVSAGRA